MKADYANIHRDIIDRCKIGDKQAQQQLYQLYARPMFTVSVRILQNRQEAEDILQEAFVDMFTKLHTFRAESSFGAWFKRIVVNKSINAVKKKKILTSDIDEMNVEDADNTHEEDDAAFPYSVQQVQKAIALLPEGYRLVFTLYMLEGCSHQEIADELGITASTSKSQFNRSKKKIRELLKTIA